MIPFLYVYKYIGLRFYTIETRIFPRGQMKCPLNLASAEDPALTYFSEVRLSRFYLFYLYRYFAGDKQ